MFSGTLNPLTLVGKPCLVNSTPPNSFNCWNLVEYVRDQCFDLKTPLIISFDDQKDPEGTIKKLLETNALAQWRLIQWNYYMGDVALLSTKDKNNPNHVGVFIKPNIIMHATNSTVMCNSVTVIKRAYKSLQVYRWPSVIS